MRFVKLIAVAKAHVEPGFPHPVSLIPCPVSRVELSGGGGKLCPCSLKCSACLQLLTV